MKRVPDMKTAEEWKTSLRGALKEAMRARQPAAVSVLRETLAAIDNAEAADLSAAPAVQGGRIAGGVAGLGAGDVARKTLTPQEVRAIVERELQEKRHAALTYARLEKHEQAQELEPQGDLPMGFGSRRRFSSTALLVRSSSPTWSTTSVRRPTRGPGSIRACSASPTASPSAG